MKHPIIENVGSSFHGPKFSLLNPQGIQNRKDSLIVNGSLTRDEGRALDEAVITTARRELPILTLLMRYGLIRTLGGLGVLVDGYNKRSGFTAASINMNGKTQAENDKADFEEVSVPIPIYSKNFTLGERELLASRQGGRPLDTAGIEEATRQVAEAIENTIVNGSTLVYDGKAIQGLVNATNRNTGSLTAVWTNTAARDILKDVRAMKNAIFTDGYPADGPFALIVPDAYWTELEDDYKAEAVQTFIDRIKRISGIVEVLPSSKLAAGNVCLLSLHKHCIDYSRALDITVVPWSSGDGMEHHFKVMAAGAPRIKSDYDDNCGIAHYS